MSAISKATSASMIENMSNAEYHSQTAISSSGIKVFNRSPLHYWNEYINPAREHKEASASMNLGSLVHTLFLEPHQFDAEYAQVPEGIDKRTKAGKEAFAAFEAESQGKCIITADQLSTARAMAAQLEAHPVTHVLDGHDGLVEASIFYADPQTGVDCRIRPDWCLPPCDAFPNGLILDLKTTDDARPAAFARTCANFGYDISAAMYVTGFQLYYQTENLPDFLFLVVERDAPHAAACYSASTDMISIGLTKLNSALVKLAQCQADGVWPGYSALINPIDLPKWAS